MEDEKDAFANINKEIEREISLIQEKHRAEVAIVSAQAGLDLAKIDANQSLSESDKIREKAKVEANLAEYKHQDKMSEIEDKRRAVQAKRSEEARKLDEHEMNTGAANTRLNDATQREDELKDSKRKHVEDDAAIKQAEEELKNLNEAKAAAEEQGTTSTYYDKDIAEHEQMISGIKGSDRYKHFNAETLDAKIAEAEKTRKGLEEGVKTAEAERRVLQNNLDNANKDAKTALEIEKSQRDSENEVYARDKAKHTIQSGDQETKASQKEVEQAQAEKKRAAEEARRQKQREREAALQDKEGTLPDDENLPVIVKSFLATSRYGAVGGGEQGRT